MKLFNKIFLGAAAVAVMGGFSSCKEEATLSGADAVYIDMAQTNLSLLAGDTVRLSARVTNASGKEINTPITWSVDDEQVVKLIDIVEYEQVPNPDYKGDTGNEDPGSPDEGDNGESEGEGEDEGEDEGDAPESPASRADGDDDGDTTEPSAPADNKNPEYLTTEHHYVGIVALQGAQGKQTFIRATLENGMYALTTVSVGRNSLDNSLQWDGNIKCSYRDIPNDTIWFNVNPINVTKDYDMNFEIKITDVVAEASNPNEAEFVYYSNEPIYVDTLLNRVGVIYTAPRMVGKAECTLTIGNDETKVSATGQIVICPEISAGLEYMSGGKMVRPGYGPETPSNIKPKQTTDDMDINKTYDVGVCLGVQSGRPEDIRNAMLADEAGYFYWTVEGSGAVVDELFYDEDYTSGFVSYIRVRSGVREGTIRVTYSMPGQDFVCDLKISDFNIAYPVNDIIVSRNDEPLDLNETFVAYLGEYGNTFTLNVNTDPDASFQFHIPEITSSDPSIVSVRERELEDGLARTFDIYKEGVVTLTLKSLDVVRTMKVEVKDRITSIGWSETALEELAKGRDSQIGVNIYWSSAASRPATSFDGQIKWTSSDPSVMTVTPDAANPIRANIHGVSDGTATITCEVEGYDTPITRQFTVYTPTGVTFTQAGIDPEIGAYIYEEMLILSLNGEEYDFYYDALPELVGHHTGSGASVDFGPNSYTDMTYDFTVTESSEEGYYYVSGYFETPDGIRYEIVNVLCSNE